MVHKCMGQQYDVLRQTALVIIIHVVIAAKSLQDVDWLVTEVDFARKLQDLIKSIDDTLDRVSMPFRSSYGLPQMYHLFGCLSIGPVSSISLKPGP